ncbi:DUF397 domain-containing protein [Streptomyces sp. NPDC002550]
MRAIDLSGVTWHKSSYSNTSGGDCLEAGLTWRKSTYSNPDGGNCLEVCDTLPSAVPVRDSKAPDGPVLLFADRSWSSFVSAVMGGVLGG